MDLGLVAWLWLNSISSPTNFHLDSVPIRFMISLELRERKRKVRQTDVFSLPMFGSHLERKGEEIQNLTRR